LIGNPTPIKIQIRSEDSKLPRLSGEGDAVIQTLALVALSWALLGLAPGPADSSAGSPRVILPDSRVLQLELARTPLAWARGYMYRETISREEGMLFLFSESSFHSMWMKNCKVTLDIMWLDEEKKVVHLETKVPPCQEEPCPNFLSMRKARYVLEIQGGTALDSGVRVGVPLRFEGVDWGLPVPR